MHRADANRTITGTISGVSRAVQSIALLGHVSLRPYVSPSDSGIIRALPSGVSP